MASTGEAYGLFWNSESGDRTYDASSFEYWLKKFFTSGVFNGDLQVLASSGMAVSVGAGYANVDGKVKFWDDAFTITLDAANSTYPRIDTIVITRDNVNRQITCEKVTGAYSGNNPQPTAPIRTDEKYQLVLAQIYVGGGVTEITQANITDTRTNTSICGYITGTVTEMDFSQFAAQFEAYYNEFVVGNEEDFDEWFEHMKDQLSEDAAGHLQEEVDDINTALAGKINTSDIANNLTTETAGKVLDASQGYALATALANKVNTSDVANNLTTTSAGKVLDARQGNTLAKMIAPVQANLTASKKYEIGEQFIYNGVLYEATALISSGGTITIGGNCTTAENVISQISNLIKEDTFSGTTTSGSIAFGVNISSRYIISAFLTTDSPNAGYSIIPRMVPNGDWYAEVLYHDTNLNVKAASNGSSIKVKYFYLDT